MADLLEHGRIGQEELRRRRPTHYDHKGDVIGTDDQLVQLGNCGSHTDVAQVDIARKLAADGTAIVIVEHDLNVIWNLCDEVHFMAEGSVVLHGSPEEIRQHKTVIEKYLGEGHV